MYIKRKKGELKELIFSTSLQLFKEKGFEEVTIDEITQACGIAKGTFYNYFPKKEAILLHLGISQMEVVQQIVQQQADSPEIKNRLLAMFAGLFAYLEENRNLIKVVFFELIRSQIYMEQESKQIETFQDAIMPIIQLGIHNGEIKNNQNEKQLAATLIAIYFQTVISWLSFPNYQDRDLYSIFMGHFELLWEGIGVKKLEVQ